MNPTVVNLIIQLLAGAVGGTPAGGLLLAGSGTAAGGTSGGGFDVASIVTPIVGGGVGGGVGVIIVGLIRHLMSGESAG